MAKKKEDKFFPNRYKFKRDDCAYNLAEIIKAAQIYYRQRFPDAYYLSYDKIRYLYQFLFDTITDSLSKGQSVTIHNFGSFRRMTQKAGIQYNFRKRDYVYRSQRSRCTFRNSAKLIELLSSTSEEELQEAFDEKVKMLDEEVSARHAEEDEKEFVEKVAEKLGIDPAIIDS